MPLTTILATIVAVLPAFNAFRKKNNSCYELIQVMRNDRGTLGYGNIMTLIIL